MISITIKAQTTEVLAKLKANRAQHADLVKEAREGYCKAAESALKEKLTELREGKLVALAFNLQPPQDYTREYDTAIAMLTLHQQAGEETIELTAMDVQQFIMDEWEWAMRFLVSNSAYSPKTRTLSAEKGYGQSR